MYSQTFIGRDIFAVVWGLGVLAAAVSVETVRFPFDLQLRDFAATQHSNFASVWVAIGEVACLRDDVMWIPESDAPWSGASTKYPDLDSLKTHLVFADPNPENYVETDKFDRLTLDLEHIREAVGHLLGSLLGGLLSGRWAFCESIREGAETPAQLWKKMLTVFRAIAPILQESGVDTAEPEALLTAAWSEWRRTAGDAWIADPSTEAGFREWLAVQVDGMGI